MDYLRAHSVWIIIVNVVNCMGEVERDILLTPKEAFQVNGRSIFYKPESEQVDVNSTDQEIRVPWEQTLKHVTYLTLHNQLNEPSNLSDLEDYKAFLKSPYVLSNEYVPKFGDIITLARGRLEKVSEDEYQFIEGQCIKCSAKLSRIVAFWIVQKIRHRDPDRTYRYEIKFSVNPNIVDKSDTKRDIRKSTLRTFILKDDDYPNSFVNFEKHVSQRRFDTKQVNEVLVQGSVPENAYSSVRYNRPSVSDLNIGEYVPNVEVQRQGVSPFQPGAYPVKYLKPSYLDNGIKILEEDMMTAPISSTHLHHHYYVTREKYGNGRPPTADQAASPVIEEDGFRPMVMNYDQTPTPVTNQIPIPPNLHKLGAVVITSPRRHHSLAPPSPPFYYVPQHHTQQAPLETFQVMQPIRVVEPTKPFVGSPQYENVYYSDPDPLYIKDSPTEGGSTPKSPDTKNYYEVNYTPNSIDVSLTVPSESQRTTSSTTPEMEVVIKPGKKPVSINDQLPPPHRDQDLTVPYIETSVVTEKSTSPVVIITPKPAINTTQRDQVSTKSVRNEVIAQTTHKTAIANYADSHRSSSKGSRTTERPILKWKAKRGKVSKLTSAPAITSQHGGRKTSNSRNNRSKFEFERIPVNVTEQVITVTPENHRQRQHTVETKESVSKTVSIKIGNKTETEFHHHSKFEIPNVELYPANLEKINTNTSNIKLYKATDRMDKMAADEAELTRSIVDHVRSLEH